MNIVLDTNCLLMSLSRRNYDVLKQTPFPRIDVIDIDEFLSLLH